jgi:acetoin utilization protein AcuB
MSGSNVVGVITETDLFKVFLELMGARQKAWRVTATIAEKPGTLARLTQAIAQNGGNFISFGMFSGPDTNSRVVTFKVEGLDKNKIREVLEPVVVKFWDMRLC